MLHVKFTPFPVIKTSRLILRPVDVSDAKEIFFLRSDSVVLTYLDKEPAQSVNETVDFIHHVNDLEKNNEAITWGIALSEHDPLIGTICFWKIMKAHYRAEIGYVLHPEYHGKGIMQEAIAAAINYGFGVMKLHSIEANVNPGNVNSIKLLERNKFVREGYYRENYYFNGRFLDSAVYSLLSPFNDSSDE